MAFRKKFFFPPPAQLQYRQRTSFNRDKIGKLDATNAMDNSQPPHASTAQRPPTTP